MLLRKNQDPFPEKPRLIKKQKHKRGFYNLVPTQGVREFSRSVSGFDQRRSWLKLSAEHLSACGRYRSIPLHARKTSGRQGCLLSRAFPTPPEVRGDEKKTRVPGNEIGVLKVT